jgi:alpha-beta hydrolase superfamily lysophospholipase/ubiquinone/menaquinone biosynthesis C-methylase UbiE
MRQVDDSQVPGVYSRVDEAEGEHGTTPRQSRTTRGLFPASLKERRRSVRLSVGIEVTLHCRHAVWHGTVQSVGFAGLYMVFPTVIPAITNERILLSFESTVSKLSIKGMVRAVREIWDDRLGSGKSSAVGLGIEFSAIKDSDAKVLASLVDGAYERVAVVKLVATLVPHDTGDLLVETQPQGTWSSRGIHPYADHETVDPGFDRRMTSRMKVSLTTYVTCVNGSEVRPIPSAVTANLSLGGLCITLRTEENLRGQQVHVRMFYPGEIAETGPGRTFSSSDCKITGRVLWVVPDEHRGAAEEPVSQAPRVRAGIQFVSDDDEEQRRISMLMRKFLERPARVEDWAYTTEVASDLKHCWNSDRLRIALYHDHPRVSLSEGTPVMILSPGYGETKKDYITLAYFLASNGIHVLRYDHTNHIGESDGDICRFTLSGMQRDLTAVIEYARRTWPSSRIGLVAVSLAGRVALRLLTNSQRRLHALVLLNSVLDITSTLHAVHQEDLVGTYHSGVRRGVINILGFNVDSNNWLEDATRQGFVDLDGTLRDAGAVQTPVLLFTAEHDVWINQQSVRAVERAFGQHLRHSYLVPEALHRLQENPRKARAVYRQIVACCQEELLQAGCFEEFVEPTQKEIGLQNRVERDRARSRKVICKAEHQEFWRDYLDNFHYISNVSDFWQLMDHIYGLMGPCDRGETILDCGCGNGNLAMFLRINQAYRRRFSRARDLKPPSYYGVDFVPSALRVAHENVNHIGTLLHQQLMGQLISSPPMPVTLCRADLEWPLPFPDNFFDRVVCNLVIGYVRDPLFTIRELVRVCSPYGRVVVSNLKAHADLSEIFRNFSRTAENEEEILEGRHLLNNSGKIKQGEGDGYFHFFDKHELTMLLQAAGANRPRVYSTFANQAYVAVADKFDAHP